MTDLDFIGYVLDLADPADRARVEAFLIANPDAVAHLERIRATVTPLEADRDEPTPPPGLATRTVGRLAAYLVAEAQAAAPVKVPERVGDASPLPTPTAVGLTHASFPAGCSEPRAAGGRFRVDLVVAAGIGLIAVGLVFSFVNRVRYQNDVLACQNNLLTLHQGLEGYADTHSGRYPQVGVEPYPTAASFVSALVDAGQCPPGFHANCPAVPVASSEPPGGYTLAVSPVTYSYSLGHLTPTGAILGVYRSNAPGDENDLIPVSADFPAESAAPGPGPTSPHRWGHNVLFAGGNVRFATTATVGVNGDDIYQNQHGRVAAGLHRSDTVLGIAGDRP